MVWQGEQGPSERAVRPLDSPSGLRHSFPVRSQIQIASRTFHFVLPPPPAPEDSPSPSSQSSANRPRSPSVDITSISPPSSLQSDSPPAPISPTHKAPPLPDPPQLPNTNVIGKGKQPKKRKASDVDAQPRPKPEVMPPKPQFTYAQLCYRAIKALDGKATLQDIISWMMENYDWYRYNEKTGWEVRICATLTSISGGSSSISRNQCDIISHRIVRSGRWSGRRASEARVSIGQWQRIVSRCSRSRKLSCLLLLRGLQSIIRSRAARNRKVVRRCQSRR